MIQGFGQIKLFTLSANPELAKGIAKHLGQKIGDSEVIRFSDGEICTRINETVRGYDVFIIQPTSPPVNENLMELLIMTDALRRSSAGRITAVIPYFGYARQDRKDRSHAPITAKLVADMITAAGADRVLSMDLHCPQLQGFFNLPLDHLRGVYLFAKYYRDKFKDLSNVVIVSPDLGGVNDCRIFAEMLDVPLAIVDKRRPKENVSEVMNFIGEVEGRDAILLDEVVTTAGTLTNAAASVMERGAKSVYACVTHPVLCEGSARLIGDSPLEELVVLNTIAVPEEKKIGKLKVLNVAKYFGNAIDCIHSGKSISRLFELD
ncbi:MAG: ribose-phosphate pyrophosphokinase [Defluviitaleaceae bacterium]|nr:ribose-phosphate pyrophosphokinase [Defluviitaleaceae bacterium]